MTWAKFDRYCEAHPRLGAAALLFVGLPVLFTLYAVTTFAGLVRPGNEVRR